MLSQVVLSLILPIPMVALLIMTGRRDVMGEFMNSRFANGTALIAAAVVLALNALLLLQVAGVPVPFLEAG